MSDLRPGSEIVALFAGHRVAANLAMVGMLLAGVWGPREEKTMRATRPVRGIAAGVLAAWTAALACDAAQASTDLNARLESEVAPALEAAMHEAGVPGVQVAVLTPDGHVWSRAFGLTDIERGTSLTAGTVLRAASISKLFTATLVMRHVEAGRIALDADVNSYLTPDRRIRDPDGDEVAVTIRQLLSHTSGLPQIGAGLGLGRALAVWLGLRPEPAFEDYVAGGFTLRRRPGTALRYSNDAYILLGWLCGHLAGTSFAEHVSAELLKPLAMQVSAATSPRSGDAFGKHVHNFVEILLLQVAVRIS